MINLLSYLAICKRHSKIMKSWSKKLKSKMPSPKEFKKQINKFKTNPDFLNNIRHPKPGNLVQDPLKNMSSKRSSQDGMPSTIFKVSQRHIPNVPQINKYKHISPISLNLIWNRSWIAETLWNYVKIRKNHLIELLDRLWVKNVRVTIKM